MSSPDLSTTYLGLELRSPLVASPSPLTGDLDTLQQLAAAGAAAVVLPSLFEEEVEGEALELDARLELGAGAFGEATGSAGYFPDLDYPEIGPGRHVRLVEQAREALDVPVIASVNAHAMGGWVRYARMLADAGAHAIELNVYDVAADPDERGDEVEARLLEAVRGVRAELEVPLAVKLSPFFSSLPSVARRLAEEGVDGLVLFNRFLQPDIDLDTLAVVPRVTLSTPDEVRLPLRWIGLLRPVLPDVSLAATSGVHSADEVAKLLLAGADVTMMTSVLLRSGPEHVAEVEAGLRTWMTAHEYASVRQLRGSVSRRTAADPTGYEHAQYYRALSSYVPVEDR
jgi:dihydroorotate dehydrogenase (fumarate)